MDVRSEPKFDLVEVTDIDVAYPGDLQTYCLRKEQATYKDLGDTIVIKFLAGGTVELYKRRAHWIAIRPRTIRVPVPEPVTPKE